MLNVDLLNVALLLDTIAVPFALLLNVVALLNVALLNVALLNAPSSTFRRLLATSCC